MVTICLRHGTTRVLMNPVQWLTCHKFPLTIVSLQSIENHVEKSDQEVTGGEAICSVSFTNVDSEEEESDSERWFMVQAQQPWGKAICRAMSECSHLPVPTTLELLDRYPCEKDIAPISISCCSPYSIKRSCYLLLPMTSPQLHPPVYLLDSLR